IGKNFACCFHVWYRNLRCILNIFIGLLNSGRLFFKFSYKYFFEK
ncbi:MAG: hypothetical protein RLZZ373_1504, partial [Pseudomonadota bacterium]